MNLILLEQEEVAADGRVRLGGRRARHVREVHRAQPGDALVVGVCGGRMGKGTVVRAEAGELELQVVLEEDPPAPSGLELLLAMPRPKILRKVLQAVSSLGVKRVVLVNSYRVEKSYFDSPLLEPSEIRENLALGLEQARDTVLPEVLVEKRFKPFVEDSLEGLWAGCRRLIAHPGDGGLRPGGAGQVGERVVVAIGPEGGWIPYEVEMLAARGFSAFSLGPRILRVDVAVPYVLAQLELARAWSVAQPPAVRGPG